MKPLGYLLISLICILSFQTSASQTINKPWTSSFGTNAINNPVREQDNGLNKYETWNQNAAGFRLSAGRLITNHLSLEGIASLNTVTDTFKDPNPNVEAIEYSYISIDAMLKYQFTNGFTFVDPYLTIGGGYTWLDSVGAGTINGGLGINLWLSNSFGINVQSVYKYALPEFGIKHLQHSAGIVFRFGGKDSDNDGINDEDDTCPDEFGTFETQGCPDADKDGVVDTDDLCPNTFGPLALRGCPDSDGDGTPDKYDKCPEVSGKVNNEGCPVIDTDKDGIVDRKDKCPKQPGTKENNGCPTKKKAQQKQQTNKTQNQKQSKSKKSVNNADRQKIIERNNAIKTKVTNELNTLARAVLFTNSNAVLSPSDKRALDEISKIMKSQPNMKFHIAGHTDSIGSAAMNMALSEKRAKNAKDYLISKGVDGSKLTSQGYGETDPIADNMTKDGRLRNRRVEIYIVN